MNLPRLKLWVLFAFFLVLSPTLHSQVPQYRFSHLTTEDGLADNMVHEFLLDSQGFMWFATQDGLSRWDGTAFKNFRPVSDDPNSLLGSIALDIVEGPDGRIWIASVGGGLNYYDPITEKITRFPHQPHNPNSVSGYNVISLYFDSDGLLWIGTFDTGLNSFDTEKEIFTSYQLADDLVSGDDAFRRNTVHDILEDPYDKNILWLAANNGLVRFEKSTGNVQLVESQAFGSAGMSIHSLYFTSTNELWMSSYGAGMVRFPTDTWVWEYYPAVPESWEARSWNTNTFWQFLPKTDTEFWIASQDQGFGIFNTKSKDYYFFERDYESPYSILANTANSIYEDANGIVWVGHPRKGVSFFSTVQPFFQDHELPLGVDSCAFFSLGKIADFEWNPERNEGYAVGGGCTSFFVFDKNLELKKTVEVEGFENQGIRFETVHLDSKGQVWVGGRRNDNIGTQVLVRPSVLKYDFQSDKLVAWAPPITGADSLNETSVFDILEDKKKRIWFAGDSGKLFCYDPGIDSIWVYQKSELLPTFPKSTVGFKTLLEDDDGRIWFGTHGQGIGCLDPEKNESKSYLVLEDVVGYELIVSDLEMDDQGRIWAATGETLRIVDPDTDSVTILSSDDGLPHNNIERLARDDFGNIWITTQKGLCQYNFSTGQVVEFGPKDGLSEYLFYEHGLKYLPWGKLLVGRTGGFFSYDIQQARQSAEEEQVVLTGLRVFEKEKRFEKNLNEIPQIELSHEENFFTFTFSALNYLQPEKIKYAHMMVGMDKDWVNIGNRAFATYTGVRPGKYTFQVKATNQDGKWSEHVASIDVVIRPPWWKTWWAYLFYALTIAALLWILRKSELKKQREKLERERRINEASAKFVPSAFLQSLGRTNILEVKLGDHVEREVTVCFADIRDYTSLAETMTPEQNFNFVTAFNARMGPIIQNCKGFVNQYLGDALMAIFPENPTDALRAAISMQKQLAEYNDRRRRKGRTAIKMGIGMHTGPLVMGIIGDEKRLDAATISDAVNTASRIESLTKYYDTNILLSEVALVKLNDLEKFSFRFLGKVQVKGRQKPVRVYECIDGDSPEIYEKKLATLGDFEVGMEHYFSKNFQQSVVSFQAALRGFPEDHMAQLFLSRSAQFLLGGVPDDWDGMESIEWK